MLTLVIGFLGEHPKLFGAHDASACLETQNESIRPDGIVKVERRRMIEFWRTRSRLRAPGRSSVSRRACTAVAAVDARIPRQSSVPRRANNTYRTAAAAVGARLPSQSSVSRRANNTYRTAAAARGARIRGQSSASRRASSIWE